MTDTYITRHVEASLCLWEAMLEQRDAKPDLNAAFEAWGTVEMRHLAIRLGPVIDKAWASLTDREQFDCVPYDWEFVAECCTQMTFGNPYDDEPNPKELAARVLERCRKRNCPPTQMMHEEGV